MLVFTQVPQGLYTVGIGYEKTIYLYAIIFHIFGNVELTQEVHIFECIFLEQ